MHTHAHAAHTQHTRKTTHIQDPILGGSALCILDSLVFARLRSWRSARAKTQTLTRKTRPIGPFGDVCPLKARPRSAHYFSSTTNPHALASARDNQRCPGHGAWCRRSLGQSLRAQVALAHGSVGHESTAGPHNSAATRPGPHRGCLRGLRHIACRSRKFDDDAPLGGAQDNPLRPASSGNRRCDTPSKVARDSAPRERLLLPRARAHALLHTHVNVAIGPER